MKAIKQQSIILFTILICCILLATSVYYYSNGDQKKNGFKRTFIVDKLIPDSQITLMPDSYFIIELLPNTILLRAGEPTKLLSATYNLKQIERLNLPIKLEPNKTNGINSMKIFGSDMFLLTGKMAMAYKINKEKKNVDSSQLDTMPFYHSEVLNANAFMLASKKKIHDRTRRIIKKVNWLGKEQKTYIPKEQKDGFFDNDGQFKYIKEANLIVYLYFYRGEIECLDTNLNTLRTIKTIDTVKYPLIQINKSEIKVGNHYITKITPAKPPVIINRRFSVSDGLIFIHSYLKSDNELVNDFSTSEVIDIYDIKNGTYRTSFYLPRIEKQRLENFSVYKNRLVTLYKNTLAVFTLPKIEGAK